MSNKTIIENKISSARKYLQILDNFKKYSRSEIEADLNVRGALERYLYLAAQATIDLAEAVVAFKKFRKPTTQSDTFHILHEQKVIDEDLTKKMVGMSGFRNVIAHDYDQVNYDLVYDVLQNRLSDIESFLQIAESI